MISSCWITRLRLFQGFDLSLLALGKKRFDRPPILLRRDFKCVVVGRTFQHLETFWLVGSPVEFAALVDRYNLILVAVKDQHWDI